MTKRAAIYARVSTDDQAQGYSLKTQVEACQGFAIERGYTVLETFADDYTGTVLDRPELNRLREFINAEHLDVVIVYDIDRLARKSVYQMLIEEEFHKSRVGVEYVLGQYDDTDEGRLQKQIRASIAEYEKAKILERSKRGKRGKAKSGFVIVGARPPYGYRVVSEPHKSWLEIDEEEAEIVRLVFQWYIYGDENGKLLTIYKILTKLIDMGIPTRGDKEQHVAKKHKVGIWSDAMIRHILKNETYTGVWHYGKTKMVSDGNEHNRKQKSKCGLGKQVPRPREEWIEVPVPSIISLEDFKKVQEQLVMNIEQAKRNTKREYLFARRLRCAKCGYTFVGMTRREKNRYYRCNGAWRTPKVCDTPYYKVDDVDNTIWEWLKNILLNPESLAEGLRGMQEETLNSNQTLFDRLNIIENRIAETDRQLEKLLDLYISDDFPKEMLQERKSRLEEVLTNLQKERTDISGHLQTIILSDEQIEDIEAFCSQLREGLENANFEQKRKIVEMLDVRGKLSIENEEKVVYVKCILGQQLLSVARTSHLSNTGET
jgi:site-specific DNA recombinase